jgi:hypothetical protein
MNIRSSILGLVLLPAVSISAQELSPKEADPVVERLTRLDGERPKTSEVSVVLDDVGIPLVPPEELQTPPPAAIEPPKAQVTEEKPVLVTGKPPEHAELLKEPPLEPAEQEKGVAVQVEKLQSGKGPIDPKKVKLLAPFPAKPLSDPPAGWMLDSSGKAPAFSREIELSPGSKITLNIKPHVLVPISDGATEFNIDEPGFDASLGFHQPTTVGTILATSIKQLDEDSKQLGDAIDRLQQLLISLPTPPAEPPVAVPVIPSTPPKKR